MDLLSRVPLLLITAILLIGGVVENEASVASSSLLAVGFVCLGAWLAIEIQTWHQRLRVIWETKSKEWISTEAIPKVLEAYDEQYESPAPAKKAPTAPVAPSSTSPRGNVPPRGWAP